MNRTVLLAVSLALASVLPFVRAQSQDGIVLQENFAPGYTYRVKSSTKINGSLSVPGEKGKPPRQLGVNGFSTIDFDERILDSKEKKLDRTVRFYRKLEFNRTVDSQEQKSSLRPEASRLVIMRHQQVEVPFSPSVPLMWGEIDLVRTDVFSPALVGLFPTTPVAAKATWQAQLGAVQELTDLERIEKGGITCYLHGVIEHGGRRFAQVSFSGDVQGLGEDGPCRHTFQGYFYFDVEGKFLSQVSLKGTQYMLDKNGQVVGKVDGSFDLARQPASSTELSDGALAGLNLQPNDENTQLLFDSTDLGVKFLYPRRWRVSMANPQGKQITLDEQRGSGLLITLDSRTKLPDIAKFQAETHDWLTKVKARILSKSSPKLVSNSPPMENFAVQVEMDKQAMVLDYYIVRQANGGALFAARFMPQDWQSLQKDVQSIARSILFTRPQ